MRKVLYLLLLTAAAPVLAAPPPLVQLDFPVLAPGESGQFRVAVPAYAGGAGRASYAAHALMPGSDLDRGYRFVAATCGEGFEGRVHYEDRGVVCSRIGQAPHAAFEMVVSVLNTGAVDGETVVEQGLRALHMDDGLTPSPWHLYGVRP